MKLIIHKLDNGGYIVSGVLNEFGGAKPVFASARLGEALSYVGMEMDPPPVTAVPVAGVCVTGAGRPADTIPISNATRANASAELAARDNRLDAAARSIADAALLLDAALNTLKP